MYIRKILLVIKLILVLLLGYVIVDVVITPQRPDTVFTPSSSVGEESTGIERTASLRQDPPRNYQVIIEKNVFGVKDSSFAQSQPSSSGGADGLNREASQELSLILLGTIYGSEAVSRAVIKDVKSNEVGLYRTNDTVANALIEGISDDAVILIHNGQKMILRLYNSQDIGTNAEPRQKSSSKAAQQIREGVKSDVSVQSASAESQTKIDVIQNLFRKAVIKPYFVNGQVEGLRITGLKDIPMACELGLKDGDIVRAVNEQRLTNQQKAFQVLQKARTQSSINVELLREGKIKKFSFNVRFPPKGDKVGN